MNSLDSIPYIGRSILTCGVCMSLVVHVPTPIQYTPGTSSGDESAVARIWLLFILSFLSGPDVEDGNSLPFSACIHYKLYICLYFYKLICVEKFVKFWSLYMSLDQVIFVILYMQGKRGGVSWKRNKAKSNTKKVITTQYKHYTPMHKYRKEIRYFPSKYKRSATESYTEFVK